MNRITRELGPIAPDVPPFPLAAAPLAALRAAAEARGLEDFSPLWCGTGVGRCTERSAAELTRELAKAFENG